MAFANLLNSVKNMIVEEDAPATPSPQTNTAGQPAKVGSTSSFKPITTVNPEMVEIIRKQTFSRNTALTALITASDALADIIPDPVMRLKAAQKTAGQGRGPKEIAEAIQIHLNDVDNAERQFDGTLKQEVTNAVGLLQRQADSAESQVQAMNTEIQTLQERIHSLQQQVSDSTVNVVKYRQDAQTKEAELAQAGTEFKAAAEAVRQELNGHKTTILSTLG